MTKRVHTPAEKKRLSYERDGRNTYGENSKASRKAIPRFKAATHREARRATEQEMTVANASHEELLDRADRHLSDRLGKIVRNGKRKSPDAPLGFVLAHKGKIGRNSLRSKREVSRKIKASPPRLGRGI
jgi:hypothetical protein